MSHDFRSVTELAGELVSTAQIDRLAQRYYWAGEFCRDKDVLEVACGVGQGLGYLASVSRSIRAGDITPALVDQACSHYGSRIRITEMNAEQLPFEPESLDVVILFEAIYYLHSAERFVEECQRVLRPDGILLVATANRDLFDFNPSPFSKHYYNPPELNHMLSSYGFDTQFFGGSPVNSPDVMTLFIRFVKKMAVTLNLIPGSMRGKRWLKRLVFGKLIPMPREFQAGDIQYHPPTSIDGARPDTVHQALYCVARLR